VFTIDAPKVDTEAVRAASDLAKGDEGRLFADDRAVCTAVLDARRGVTPAADVELAIDHQRLHYFDPATGETLGVGARAVALA
jgi:multiple sugar transport system ATP-binding protein